MKKEKRKATGSRMKRRRKDQEVKEKETGNFNNSNKYDLIFHHEYDI